MKNRLLAAMALCAATSSTMPLWASEWADPTLQTVDPNLATDGTGGGEYYIYHPYSGLWLTKDAYRRLCHPNKVVVCLLSNRCLLLL